MTAQIHTKDEMPAKSHPFLVMIGFLFARHSQNEGLKRNLRYLHKSRFILNSAGNPGVQAGEESGSALY
ncbi:hypothetical protein CSR02_04810 [Acetobacter pomorum]|uniref:Uncharacterized protein n=1 Tax=Acetobacter pomorum TaxID=65959 RepID=A0A2G4RGA1_9PROT|nr:hypothetical protein CSR02_04810 [Acetobacter pomorum]